MRIFSSTAGVLLLSFLSLYVKSDTFSFSLLNIFKFQDSKEIIVGIDMFSAMSKGHASYTSILLSADFI